MRRVPIRQWIWILSCGIYLVGLGPGELTLPVNCCVVNAAPPESARTEPVLRRFESTQPQMGVPFKIILYAADEMTANQAFQAAFTRIGELNKIMSDYDLNSELSRLSRTGPSEVGVPVSEPLWQVLSRAQALAEKSHGAFDITVGPYVRLWRRARREKQMPSAERLEEARAAVGYRHLKLDAELHTARLLKGNMRLDLGGIAMGYAVDETLRLLRERGIKRALVDASGDVGVGDPPPGERGWKIGILPLADPGTPGRYILLANAAVTTSGDVFQHVDIDGKRYSHIVDPHTGLGLTDRTGVAVIAPDCTSADSLTKVVAVLGPKAGLEFIEGLLGTAAFIARPTEREPETFESSRFGSYVMPSDN